MSQTELFFSLKSTHVVFSISAHGSFILLVTEAKRLGLILSSSRSFPVIPNLLVNLYLHPSTVSRMQSAVVAFAATTAFLWAYCRSPLTGLSGPALDLCIQEHIPNAVLGMRLLERMSGHGTALFRSLHGFPITLRSRGKILSMAKETLYVELMVTFLI